MLDMNDEQRVYLVTGATSGIGLAVAIALAQCQARVLLGARTEQSGRHAVERIRAQVPGAYLTVIAGDLAEMRQVRTLADRVRQETIRLDGLILNAAELRGGHTSEGLAVIYATNYLAGFFLTDLLLPQLRDSAPARVVAVSSSMHARIKRLDLAALPTTANYETTKLLNVMFVSELARRTAAESPRISPIPDSFEPTWDATQQERSACSSLSPVRSKPLP